MTFSKRQNHSDGLKGPLLRGCQEMCETKRQHRWVFWGDETVLKCVSGGYMNLCMC